MIAHMKGKPKKRGALNVKTKDHIDPMVPTPNWLKDIGDKRKHKGFESLFSTRQIDAEIGTAHHEHREKTTK